MYTVFSYGFSRREYGDLLGENLDPKIEKIFLKKWEYWRDRRGGTTVR